MRISDEAHDIDQDHQCRQGDHENNDVAYHPQIDAAPAAIHSTGAAIGVAAWASHASPSPPLARRMTATTIATTQSSAKEVPQPSGSASKNRQPA